MRTLLICDASEHLNREVLPRWMASFSTLAGVVVLEEPKQRKWKRLKREIRRVGFLRFLDVLAFRIYYRSSRAHADREWEAAKVEELCQRYSSSPETTPVLQTASPNTPEAREFIANCRPDIVIARCKSLLKEDIFSIPSVGTFVMHPGICPEYRNAHGCFWALANRDLTRVGMTLLKIDKGVDTGPVYGYFHCHMDEVADSHIIIQLKAVFDNLEAIAARLREIAAGGVQPIDVTGRSSNTWGQPWFTKYLQWKRAANSARRSGDATV